MCKPNNVNDEELVIGWIKPMTTFLETYPEK